MLRQTRTLMTAIAAVVASLAGGIELVSAQSVPSTPPLNLSLSVNGSINGQAYQGWAWVFDASVYNQNRFSMQTLLAPFTIAAQNGSWTNTVRLLVTDSSGLPQSWPAKLITVPANSLTLDQTTVGRFAWVVAPSDTSAIAPGTYSIVAFLNAGGSGAVGLSGLVNSYSVSVQVSAPPSPATAAQQEQEAELLATYDHLLGNDTQAVADIDTLLAQQPNAVGALAAKGDFLAQLGQTSNALASYDQALAAFYAANPGPPEPPSSLLGPQSSLRSQLLSQSATRGVPEISVSLLNQGVQSPGVIFLDLQFTNIGSDVAENVLLRQLAFATLSGTGQATLNNVLSPPMPIYSDFLSVNNSVTVRIFVSLQGTVGSFSLTETGTAADIFGTPASFSATQTITPNSKGGGTPLTVAAANATQQYGQPTPNLNNATYFGFVNGDTPTSLSGALNCATTTTSTSPVGSYPITCSGLSSPNYVITYAPGTLTITPAPLNVAANDASARYGQAIVLNGALYSGFVNGDTSASLGGTLNCTTMATTSSPVGVYLITCSSLTSTNYSISFVPGTLTITPAPLTITANNASRQYGVANPPLNSVTASGFVNGDMLASLTGNLVCTTAAVPASPAGNYPILCSGLSSSNYTTTFLPGTLTIASDVLTVTASNATRQYGSASPSFTARFVGFVNGDTAASLGGTLACTTSATSTAAVGMYPINCSGLTSPNYTITYLPGGLTITPAPLAIAASNASRPYGANNPVFTGMISGVQNTDPITASFTATALPASPVGIYAITPVALDPANRLANYTVSLVNGTLSVVPETTVLSVAISPGSIPVGQPATVTVSLTAPDMVIPIDLSVLAAVTLTSPVSSDILSNNGVCTPIPGTAPGVASCTVTVTSVEPNGRTLNASFAGSAELAASSSSGNLIVTAGLTSQQVCIASDFRNVAVPGGSTIWFNSIFKVRDVPKQLFHVAFYQSTVQFQYTDASGSVVNVNRALPNARITVDPNAIAASTTFDPMNNLWVTTIPWDLDDNAFLTGMPWVVPSAGLPADVEPVTVCGTFASDAANLDVGWRWAAAAYSSFSTDNNTLRVKPMDTDHDNPDTNHDRAGTPENYKQFMIPGARGKGAKNYTGSYSGSSTIE